MKRTIALFLFLGVAQNALGAANNQPKKNSETISKWPFTIEVFNVGSQYEIEFQYKKKSEQGWTKDIIPPRSRHFLIANEIQPVVRFKAIEKLGVIGTLPTTEFDFSKKQVVKTMNIITGAVSKDFFEDKLIPDSRWENLDGRYRLLLDYPSRYSWKLEGELKWKWEKEVIYSDRRPFRVKTDLVRVKRDLELETTKLLKILNVKKVFPGKWGEFITGEFIAYEYLKEKEEDPNLENIRVQFALMLRAQAALILGVDEDADFKVKRKAYFKLAHKWHPDRNKSPEAGQVFKLINHAYQILEKDNSTKDGN